MPIDGSCRKPERPASIITPSSMPAMAFSARPRQGQGVFSFTHDGKEYVASLSNLAAEFSKTWQIFTITPLSDFTGPFQANNDRLVLFGLLAVALQIVIIYFLTS